MTGRELDLARLREVALAAGSGEWVAFRARDSLGGDDWIGVTRDLQVDYDPDVFASQRTTVADAEHIAAANPVVVLALVEELERLRRAMERGEGLLSRWRKRASAGSTQAARCAQLLDHVLHGLSDSQVEVAPEATRDAARGSEGFRGDGVEVLVEDEEGCE